MDFMIRSSVYDFEIGSSNLLPMTGYPISDIRISGYRISDARFRTLTWWWNDEVAALVQEKKRLFRLWKGPRKCKCQERCRCKKGVGVELASVG